MINGWQSTVERNLILLILEGSQHLKPPVSTYEFDNCPSRLVAKCY